MPEAKLFSISAFPKDEAYWRIDWMERIQKNPQVPSEPLVSIFLTKLRHQDKPSLTTPLINPLLPSSLDADRRHIAEIGVGLLPLVWGGSVWKNGRRIDEGWLRPTRQFTVDTSLAKAIKFSDSIGHPDRYRLIPAFEYPLGANSWAVIRNSSLMALPFDGDPFGILIPAIEVIRFYYVYSSSSARCVFQGQYNLLYSDPQIGMDGSLPHVTLKLNWYSRHDDAWLLARYIASETMQRRANRIHDWVKRDNMKYSEKGFTESIFPFDGVTTLKAEGTSIKGEDGRTRFLVTRLLNCTYAMPYSDVTILVEHKTPSPGEAEIQRPTMLATWPTGLDPAKQELENGEEPDRYIERMMLEANEVRFSALTGKELNKIYQKVDRPRRKRGGRKSEKKKRGIGTGEGDYREGDLSPGEINQNFVPKEAGAPPTLKNFVAALKILRSMGLQVTTIGVGENVEPFEDEKISHFQKDGSSNKQWSVIRCEDNKVKRRGFVVAEVSTSQRFAYVIELERNPGSAEKYSTLVIASRAHEKIPNSELDTFVRNCSQIGRWLPEHEMQRYRRETATHRERKNKDDTQHGQQIQGNPDLGGRIYAALQRIKLVTS